MENSTITKKSCRCCSKEREIEILKQAVYSSLLEFGTVTSDTMKIIISRKEEEVKNERG